MQSILYSHYVFVTQTIMLHFLTETCISCGRNSLGIRKLKVCDMEKENAKSVLRVIDVGCVHICVLSRFAIFRLGYNECLGLLLDTVFVSLVFEVCAPT
jgi:hypothetical protein